MCSLGSGCDNCAAVVPGGVSSIVAPVATASVSSSVIQSVGGDGLAAMQELFAKAVEELGEGEDHSAVIKILK